MNDGKGSIWWVWMGGCNECNNVQKMGWFKLHKAPRSMAVLDSFGECWCSENGEKIIAKNWMAQEEGVQFSSFQLSCIHVMYCKYNSLFFFTHFYWSKRDWTLEFDTTTNDSVSILLICKYPFISWQVPTSNIQEQSHESSPMRAVVRCTCTGSGVKSTLGKKIMNFSLPVYPKSSFFKFGLVVFPDFFFQNLRWKP